METTAASTQPGKAHARKREYTPEDLLRLTDGHRYELVEGKLEERSMGAEASEIGLSLMMRVAYHVHSKKLGKCFGADCGYQIFTDKPTKVRYADGSFIAKGRLPERRTPRGHMKVAPDLAIEAISPHEKTEKTEVKRVEYLKAGVRLLWFIYPETRSVHVYRQDGTVSVLGPDDELTGEDVLPGFVCKVAELFGDVE